MHWSFEVVFPFELVTVATLLEILAVEFLGLQPCGICTMTRFCTLRDFGQSNLAASAAIAEFMRIPKHVHINMVFNILWLLWLVLVIDLARLINSFERTHQ